MLQKFENLPPNWNDIEDERQHNLLKCLSINVSGDETLTVVITFLKRTFNYYFWIRATAYPEGHPKNTKQIDINRHNPLLEYLSEALNDYKDFLDTHLNSHQLYILGHN